MDGFSEPVGLWIPIRALYVLCNCPLGVEPIMARDTVEIRLKKTGSAPRRIFLSTLLGDDPFDPVSSSFFRAVECPIRRLHNQAAVYFISCCCYCRTSTHPGNYITIWDHNRSSGQFCADPFCQLNCAPRITTWNNDEKLISSITTDHIVGSYRQSHATR